MADRLVAKWASRGARYTVSLFHSPGGEDLGYGLQSVAGYHYVADGGAGNLGNFPMDADAIKVLEPRVGIYQPDANRTPMRRVV